MKLKKSLLPLIALCGISVNVFAHEIGVSVEPGHYTLYAGQWANLHCIYGIHIGNHETHAVTYHIAYWLSASGYSYPSTKEEDVTLQPGQYYDKAGTDLYIPVKYELHNYTATLTGGINITPQGEPMQQYPAKTYISVY